MKTRRKHVTKNSLTISPSSNSMKRRKYSRETIPIDLIIEILSRLPAKSIARFRRVSKLWDSIILRPDFTEFYMKRSYARPKKLLFSCEKNGGLIFFSSPQTQTPSLVVCADRLTRFRFNGSCEICGTVSGLVYRTHDRIIKGRKKTMRVIGNPSTGQSLLLPKVKRRRSGVDSFFGYDPIEKQFKVLSMTSTEDHQVLTLGTTQKLSWRMIESYIPHYHLSNGICINGGLYYHAILFGPPKDYVIACFDVRFEKFIFINRAEDMIHWRSSTLVNYMGKLGILSSGLINVVTGKNKCLELWVLVDAEKHEWSKHVYVLPPLWKNLVAGTTLDFAGVTGTNEIVLSPRYLSDPFYVFYYNIERKTMTRVEIQGMDAFKNCRLYTSLDHVDDFRLMH